uniref:ZAD domain-containing protein n=1 Tax=Heliothis virescens TaxID=7102 RepID=A0A2A4K6P6_HELVI
MTEPEDLNFTAFTDLCRLCSLKSGPRLHIFDKESEQRQILFKLRTCLPTMQISKDDFLPKKICERCVTRLEQLYEWRQSCLSTDSVLRNYAESMKIVTSTINFQYSSSRRLGDGSAPPRLDRPGAPRPLSAICNALEPTDIANLFLFP